MNFARLKVAVNSDDNTMIVQRSQWEALPEFVQKKAISDLEREHGARLTLKVIDGDPHDEEPTVPVEVDNLLIPDDVRVAQLHYANGGVEVAVLTKKGWLRILESGEHLCEMPTPYFEEAPPIGITFLSKLPESGLGNTSVNMMDDDVPSFKLRGKTPSFLDASENLFHMDLPEPESATVSDDEPQFTGKFAELMEQFKDEPIEDMSPGEAARVSFERMYAGVLAAEEENPLAELSAVLQPGLTAFSLFLKSCMNFDRDQPETAWDAFNGALETLMVTPHEYGLNTSDREDVAKDGRMAMEQTANHEAYKTITEAIKAGKPFAEWSEDFHVLRIMVAGLMFKLLKTLDED